MGTTMCGWCMTGQHDKHKPSGTYYDQTWTCPCTVCASKKENTA